MQKVVFDEPYRFVPPNRGRLWPWAMGKYLPRLVRSRYGITGWTTTGVDSLRESLQKGHGVILCPNHCRAADPLMIGAITTATPCAAYAMASWHVFRQSWLETFICRRIGGFSVYREGMDRKALDLAIEIVSTAERPLVIFPEGVISSANDRLLPLMDGTAFIARAAAKKRQRVNPDSRVVIHPVIFHYEHRSDPEVTLPPVLSKLETQLFWQTQEHRSAVERVALLDEAVQSLREVQFLGEARTGSVEERSQQLANEIVQTHEREWLGRARTGDIVARVKDLRIAMIPAMTTGTLPKNEHKRRWKHLTDLYYAQTMVLNVPGYLSDAGNRYRHRLFEVLERIEEDMTDRVTPYNDMHVDVRIGEAIDVEPASHRGRTPDPLMMTLRERMLNLLGVEDRWVPGPVQDLPASE